MKCVLNISLDIQTNKKQCNTLFVHLNCTTHKFYCIFKTLRTMQQVKSYPPYYPPFLFSFKAENLARMDHRLIRTNFSCYTGPNPKRFVFHLNYDRSERSDRVNGSLEGCEHAR